MTEAQMYLMQLRKIDESINDQIGEVQQMYELATSITATLKDNPSFGGTAHDKIGDAVAKIADYQSSINMDIDALIDLKTEATKMLKQLTKPDHYSVLYRRYVLCQSFNRISEETHNSIRWVFMLHGRALQEYGRIMKKEGVTYAPENIDRKI